MDNHHFDQALISAAFDLAAEGGWGAVGVAEAARRGGLELARARERFPSRSAVPIRFGVLTDQAALREATAEATVRERLFDLLMRRFDVLQAHRDGVLALLRALPFHPANAAVLAIGTRVSMGWMLDAAGVSTGGLAGRMRAQGLVGVWLSAARAWQRDATADLSDTMLALDKALGRAERVATLLPGSGARASDSDAIDGGDDLRDGAAMLELSSDGAMPAAP